MKEKIGIFGFKKSGQAIFNILKDFNCYIFINDASQDYIDLVDIIKKAEKKATVEYVFTTNSDLLLNCDIIILSPGIPSNLPILKKAKDKNIEIISEIEFLFRYNIPNIISVTGTDGKSTTTALIYEILKHHSNDSYLAGNIGYPLSSYFDNINDDSYVALELSSYQLENLNSFKSKASIILNLAPDHLTRYNSVSDYYKTKFNIFMNQTKDDFAIINHDDAQLMKTFNENKNLINSEIFFYSIENEVKGVYIKDEKFFFNNGETETVIADVSELKILGLHNISNACAAILSTYLIGIDIDTIKKGLNSFSGLEHRLEYVKQLNNIHFINDSKSTNTHSTQAALNSFYDKKLILFLGGSVKDEDFSQLNPFIKNNLLKIIVSGDNKDDIINNLNCDSIEEVENFETWINESLEKYFNIDEDIYFLFSPASASFDRFRNFEHRGNYFKDFINSLKF